MRKITGRTTLVLLLVGVAAASGAALLAGAGQSAIGARPDQPAQATLPIKGFTACPVPACMAPCVYPPAPQGLCKGPGGGIEETSYFCCCCGGGGNSFKWLK